MNFDYINVNNLGYCNEYQWQLKKYKSRFMSHGWQHKTLYITQVNTAYFNSALSLPSHREMSSTNSIDTTNVEQYYLHDFRLHTWQGAAETAVLRKNNAANDKTMKHNNLRTQLIKTPQQVISIYFVYKCLKICASKQVGVYTHTVEHTSELDVQQGCFGFLSPLSCALHCLDYKWGHPYICMRSRLALEFWLEECCCL